MKIKVRNCSKNYCLSTLNTASEGKFEGKFEAADREKTALDSLDRVDQNHLTEKDEFSKQLEQTGRSRRGDGRLHGHTVA